MSVTQADIDALNAAIAQGETLVRKKDGTTVQYRSVPDLIRARNDQQSQLNAQSATPRNKIVRVSQSGRGFD